MIEWEQFCVFWGSLLQRCAVKWGLLCLWALWVFLMWQHTCAASACKYEPFDCTVVSSPWLQVVQPNRTQGKPVFYILLWREHSPNYFVLLFFILDWTRVYLFGNKPCESVTISMHAFLFVLYCNAQVVTSSAQRDKRVTRNKTITYYTDKTNRILQCILNTRNTIWTFYNTLNVIINWLENKTLDVFDSF